MTDQSFLNERENSARLAAEVFMKNVLGVLSSLDYSVSQISNACLPFLAVEWNRRILTSIGGRRLNNFMARVRISRLPKNIYAKILSATKIRDVDESSIMPPNLEEWRRIIVRFGLNSEIPFQKWIITIHLIETRLISSPGELSALSKIDIGNIFGAKAFRHPLFNCGRVHL